MKYCSIKWCKTKSGDKISLHNVKKEWLTLAKWKNDSPTRICSLHLEKKFFATSTQKYLRKNAVPSKYLSDDYTNVLHDHCYAVPCAQELLRKLHESDSKVEHYAKKLYKSESVKRKLHEKVRTLEDAVSECKSKFSLTENSFEELKKASAKVPMELFERVAKKHKYFIRPMYSPAIRKFALTLHHHSPAAYRYFI